MLAIHESFPHSEISPPRPFQSWNQALIGSHRGGTDLTSLRTRPSHRRVWWDLPNLQFFLVAWNKNGGRLGRPRVLSCVIWCCNFQYMAGCWLLELLKFGMRRGVHTVIKTVKIEYSVSMHTRWDSPSLWTCLGHYRSCLPPVVPHSGQHGCSGSWF